MGNRGGRAPRPRGYTERLERPGEKPTMTSCANCGTSFSDLWVTAVAPAHPSGLWCFRCAWDYAAEAVDCEGDGPKPLGPVAAASRALAEGLVSPGGIQEVPPDALPAPGGYLLH